MSGIDRRRVRIAAVWRVGNRSVGLVRDNPRDGICLLSTAAKTPLANMGREIAMSFVTVSEGPATAEDVDAMRHALEQAGVPKPLVHIAGPVEGGFRVINVWATQADVEAA